MICHQSRIYFESPWAPGNLGCIGSIWWGDGPGDIARCRGDSHRPDPSSKDESSSCLPLLPLFTCSAKPTITDSLFQKPCLKKKKLDFDPDTRTRAASRRCRKSGERPLHWTQALDTGHKRCTSLEDTSIINEHTCDLSHKSQTI